MWCVEERINGEMSGEVCGDIDNLDRRLQVHCTLHNTEPGLAAAATANICFFSGDLISSQDGWNVSHFYL